MANGLTPYLLSIIFYLIIWGEAPLYHFPIFHFEAAVELLAGAFPAVMAPEPDGGVAADGGFELAEVDVGELPFGHRLGVAGDESHLAVVVAAAQSGDVGIEDGMARGACYALGAREDGRVVVEEVHPVVDVHPVGFLVGDVAHADGSAFTPIAHHLAQRVVHGDALGSEPLAHLQEKAVGGGVLKRVVDLCALHVGRHPEGQRGDPLPVAHMSEEDGARLSAVEHLVELVGAGEGHATAQLPLADGHEFDGLHEVVAEVAVEAALNLLEFLWRLLGEGGQQVVPDDAVAISHDAAHQQVE